MTLYITTMDYPDTFETIQSATNQREAIDSYMRVNAGLSRFLKWYIAYDPSKVQSKLDYTNDVTHKIGLIRCIGDLESLHKYPEAQQVKILNNILSKVTERGMMLLENCLTRDLKNYYPDIDWEYFKTKYNLSI